jgi:hypothetical protein
MIKSIFIALTLSASFTFAGPLETIKAGCQQDIDNHCKAEEAQGHKQVRKCLKAHKSELSKQCKDAIKTVRKEKKASK